VLMIALVYKKFGYGSICYDNDCSGVDLASHTFAPSSV